jgi:hypothetical protein
MSDAATYHQDKRMSLAPNTFPPTSSCWIIGYNIAVYRKSIALAILQALCTSIYARRLSALRRWFLGSVPWN